MQVLLQDISRLKNHIIISSKLKKILKKHLDKWLNMLYNNDVQKSRWKIPPAFLVWKIIKVID